MQKSWIFPWMEKQRINLALLDAVVADDL